MLGNINKWSIREAIQSYERSHKNYRDHFTRTNKVIIFGKAETELKWHHSSGTEVFYTVTIEVDNSQTQHDHIPVLISSKIIKKKKLQASFKGSFIKVVGQLRSYDFIIDGYRQTPMFVFAKTVSVFQNNDNMEEQSGENVVFLEGDISEYPITYYTSNGEHITELIVNVYGNNDSVYLIPCVIYGKYAELATSLKYGDHISFYGRIQDKKKSQYYSSSNYMCDYCTTHQVSVVDVKASTMFSRIKI